MERHDEDLPWVDNNNVARGLERGHGTERADGVQVDRVTKST